MEHVVVGKIVNTRGLKGEVKVVNYSDFKDLRYKKGKKIEIFNETSKEYTSETISSFSEDHKFVYLNFKGLSKIEEVEKYKGCLLIVKSDGLEKLEEDSYHYHQLINANVFYQNEKIGFIKEIISVGDNQLIRVADENRSFLVPFVDEFVEKVDIEGNNVILINLVGLI